MAKINWQQVVTTAFVVKAIALNANISDVLILGMVLGISAWEAYLAKKTVNVDTSKVLDKVSSLEAKLAALSMMSRK